MQKDLEIEKEIEVPANVLLKESTVEAAHKVIELLGNLQQLVVTDVGLNDAGESKKEKATCSEAAASEAPRGNSNSHNISNIIDIGSSILLLRKEYMICNKGESMLV